MHNTTLFNCYFSGLVQLVGRWRSPKLSREIKQDCWTTLFQAR